MLKHLKINYKKNDTCDINHFLNSVTFRSCIEISIIDIVTLAILN